MKVTSGPLMDDATRAALASGRAEPSLALFIDVLMQMRGISASEGEAIAEAEARRGWSLAGPGIKRLPLGVGAKARAEIIRLEAGVKVPWHSHKGQELTLCIHGEFSDSRATYGPGDFSISDPSIRHQPLAYTNGPAYALAVTDAGLKFEGLLGALQKLMGG